VRSDVAAQAQDGVKCDASLDEALAVLGEKLLDRNWRLSNMYYVTDKSGQRVRFVPNWAQLRLFDSLAHRNVDLKVWQLGALPGIASCGWMRSFSIATCVWGLWRTRRTMR